MQWENILVCKALVALEYILYKLIVKMACHSMSHFYGLKCLKIISSQTCCLLSITNIVSFLRPVAMRGSFVYE